MHAQEARLQGTVHCLHTMEDIPEVPTIILTQPAMPILYNNPPNLIEHQPNSAIHPTSNIVQLIMPPNFVVNLPLTTTDSPAITTTTIDTHSTTESLVAPTTAVTATSSEVPTIVVVDVVASSTVSSDPATGQPTVVAAFVTDPKEYTHPMVSITTEAERSTTTQPTSSSEPTTLEEQPMFFVESDNSVNESFSPIEAIPDRSQQLLEPDEPPEHIHDDTAPI